jgi:hypothetical protein
MEIVLMRWQAIGSRVFLFLAVVALLVGGPLDSQVMGQAAGGGGGAAGGGGNTGGGGGAGGGGNNQNNQNQINTGAAGVVVDAAGTLRMNVVRDIGGQAMRQRQAAAMASLSPEVTRRSPLRKVSLNRLEAAIRAKNGVITDEERYLAGLLRVRYVFFYPESGDIVLAGPAEGWASDPAGRMVGFSTGRPVIQLQDLVVALRAFPPDQTSSPVIGCSIDPTAEGLAAMQQFLRNTGSVFYAPPTLAQTQYIATGLRNSLGMQQVSIDGVAPDTHFAQVLVEADYRMKLIGIGLEQPPVRMVSFVDAASPSQVARNALFRWYFVPDYECVRVSDNGLAMELVGDGVKLVGENEMVTDGGQRRMASKSSRASQVFTNSFTKSYAQLAERSPVYAELRNLIDLAVAAAYIQHEDLYHKANWTMEFLGDEAAFSVRTYNAPKKVASTVAAVWKGGKLVTPIGGGVQIQADRALDSENLLSDEDGAVATRHAEAKIELAEAQWWWD